ncbi:protein N-terminal asparagine amidohydrolase isoform X2 [Pseudophryne corroboree]|uniref:protein N-terminal asparagine amidohydrolase isoform X2 n=1 Tax=Pseudophryne corroboree TaxID=495146 RepID=UPI0030819CD6
MPLLMDSKRLDVRQSVSRVIQMHPRLKERAKELTNQSTHVFGPKGFLYVQQRELAVTTPNDSSISLLGSEDATTCHILVLRHTGSGATCLAHCDGSDTEKEVADILHSVKSLSPISEGRLELHIVGGFHDQRQLSQKLSHQLLKIFDKQPEEVHLVTFCVTAVNVKTGEIFKAKFPDHQPDEDLRSAYILTGGQMVNIYDAKAEQLNIGPYTWTTIPNIDYWLKEDDENILHCFSTSPLAEPPHFVQHMRSALQFLKDNPHPQTSTFPDGKPHSYRKLANGQWERISSPP